MRGKNKKRNSISCVKLFSKQQMNEWMNDRPTDRPNEWMTDWLNFIQVSEYLDKDDIQNGK